MQIVNLRLKDFRCHAETVLELDRYNFIRGPNSCGKSSVQMALEFLFTGRCKLTDAAGRGAESLIRTGAKELEISATLENGQMLCRRRGPRSQVVELDGNRIPIEAAADYLEKRFGPIDVLSAVLNADRFVEMPESEQQRFLAQLIEAGKVDIPEEIRDALRAINEEPPGLASVVDVEAAHKRFYDLRTETSRALKAMGHMEKLDIPPDLPSEQQVRKKLDELRQQKERLIAQQAAEDTCWQNAQGRLKQVQAELEEISSEILSPSQEQELLQLESQRGHAERLRQELTDLVAQQKTVVAALAAAQGLADRCPTCGQPISQTMRAEELETLNERLSDIEGLIQGTREELNECSDVDAVTSRLEAHRRALARRTKLLEEPSKVQAAQKPDAADLESRMTILVERINKGERVLEKAQQGQSAQQMWEAHIREKSSLEARISILDRLVEFLGPNGAMMGQASGRMESFTEDLNRHLAAFGYACNLALEPFEIRISSSKDNQCGLPLKHLSESEQFRFDVAFQIALAMATDLRFVVIDRADVLDKEKRKMLTCLLVNSGLDQAIVLATSEEAAPSLVPQGVRFLSLAEGMKRDEALVSTAATPSASVS